MSGDTTTLKARGGHGRPPGLGSWRGSLIAGTSAIALIVPVMVACSYDPGIYRASLPYAGDIEPTVPRPQFAQAPSGGAGEAQLAEVPAAEAPALPQTLNAPGGAADLNPQLVPEIPEETAVGAGTAPPAVPVPQVVAAPLPGVTAAAGVTAPLPRLTALAEVPAAPVTSQTAFAPGLPQLAALQTQPARAVVAAPRPDRPVVDDTPPQLAAVQAIPAGPQPARPAVDRDLPQLATLDTPPLSPAGEPPAATTPRPAQQQLALPRPAPVLPQLAALQTGPAQPAVPTARPAVAPVDRGLPQLAALGTPPAVAVGPVDRPAAAPVERGLPQLAALGTPPAVAAGPVDRPAAAPVERGLPQLAALGTPPAVAAGPVDRPAAAPVDRDLPQLAALETRPVVRAPRVDRPVAAAPELPGPAVLRTAPQPRPAPAVQVAEQPRLPLPEPIRPAPAAAPGLPPLAALGTPPVQPAVGTTAIGIPPATDQPARFSATGRGLHQLADRQARPVAEQPRLPLPEPVQPAAAATGQPLPGLAALETRPSGPPRAPQAPAVEQPVTATVDAAQPDPQPQPAQAAVPAQPRVPERRTAPAIDPTLVAQIPLPPVALEQPIIPETPVITVARAPGVAAPLTERQPPVTVPARSLFGAVVTDAPTARPAASPSVVAAPTASIPATAPPAAPTATQALTDPRPVPQPALVPERQVAEAAPASVAPSPTAVAPQQRRQVLEQRRAAWEAAIRPAPPAGTESIDALRADAEAIPAILGPTSAAAPTPAAPAPRAVDGSRFERAMQEGRILSAMAPPDGPPTPRAVAEVAARPTVGVAQPELQWGDLPAPSIQGEATPATDAPAPVAPPPTVTDPRVPAAGGTSATAGINPHRFDDAVRGGRIMAADPARPADTPAAPTDQPALPAVDAMPDTRAEALRTPRRIATPNAHRVDGGSFDRAVENGRILAGHAETPVDTGGNAPDVADARLPAPETVLAALPEPPTRTELSPIPADADLTAGPATPDAGRGDGVAAVDGPGPEPVLRDPPAPAPTTERQPSATDAEPVGPVDRGGIATPAERGVGAQRLDRAVADGRIVPAPTDAADEEAPVVAAVQMPSPESVLGDLPAPPTVSDLRPATAAPEPVTTVAALPSGRDRIAPDRPAGAQQDQTLPATDATAAPRGTDLAVDPVAASPVARAPAVDGRALRPAPVSGAPDAAPVTIARLPDLPGETTRVAAPGAVPRGTGAAPVPITPLAASAPPPRVAPLEPPPQPALPLQTAAPTEERVVLRPPTVVAAHPAVAAAPAPVAGLETVVIGGGAPVVPVRATLQAQPGRLVVAEPITLSPPVGLAPAGGPATGDRFTAAAMADPTLDVFRQAFAASGASIGLN